MCVLVYPIVRCCEVLLHIKEVRCNIAYGTGVAPVLQGRVNMKQKAVLYKLNVLFQVAALVKK